MNPYQTHAFEGASGVELTVALYDGIIRFMHRAIDAVECGDAGERRAAVKRAMDIVIHLQATLQMDIGGKPAEALAEFYAAMFSLMLQGSQSNSREKFERVIACVRNVRNAWRQVANAPNADPDSQRITSSVNRQNQLDAQHLATDPLTATCWTA
jgi:flagellar secretion chaperone FliS